SFNFLHFSHHFYFFRFSAPNGTPCSPTTTCTSTFCVDGYCCNNACLQNCHSCNQASSLGVCTSLPAGSSDPFCSTGRCIAGGVCLGDLGDACTLGNQCQTTFCVDKVCCDSTCTGNCLICNKTTQEGACVTDPACSPSPSPTPLPPLSPTPTSSST